MSPVVLQILFFFVAAGSVFAILFFTSVSEAEVNGDSSGIPTRPLAGETMGVSKKFSQIIMRSITQPREIFVHSKNMLGRMRGEREQSVLDKNFEQASERTFSLEDVAPPAPSAIRNEKSATARAKAKPAPKLVQKLQDQFEQRNEVGNEGVADPEEEFWLGILRQNPHNAHPYKKLGEIYLNKGAYKEAQASLAFALRKSPEDKDVMALLAQLKERQGKK